jgi:hypothetical protein
MRCHCLDTCLRGSPPIPANMQDAEEGLIGSKMTMEKALRTSMHPEKRRT